MAIWKHGGAPGHEMTRARFTFSLAPFKGKSIVRCSGRELKKSLPWLPTPLPPALGVCRPFQAVGSNSESVHPEAGARNLPEFSLRQKAEPGSASWSLVVPSSRGRQAQGTRSVPQTLPADLPAFGAWHSANCRGFGGPQTLPSSAHRVIPGPPATGLLTGGVRPSSFTRARRRQTARCGVHWFLGILRKVAPGACLTNRPAGII